MKKLFIVFLLLSLAGLPSFSQCTGKKDDNGFRQGEWKCYFDKGHTRLRSVRNYRDDVLHGEQQYYKKNGKLYSVAHYSEGRLCEMISVKNTGERRTIMKLKCR